MIVVGVTETVHNLLLWVGEFLGFLLLIWFFVAKKFGSKRRSILQTVNGILDARAARIDAQLRMAEESREEARKAHEQAQDEIAQAHEEAREIVARAQGLTETLRDQLSRGAEEEKERIVAQARMEIEAERNRAVLELRTKAADVAIDAAREVLREALDESTDRAIVERALAEDEIDGSNGRVGHA